MKGLPERFRKSRERSFDEINKDDSLLQVIGHWQQREGNCRSFDKKMDFLLYPLPYPVKIMIRLCMCF